MSVAIADVARYILEKRGSMPMQRLQTLCYYAQAWELACFVKKLFDADFEAQTDGPICMEFAEKYKDFAMIGAYDIADGHPETLSDEEKWTIEDVLQEYGNYTDTENASGSCHW